MRCDVFSAEAYDLFALGILDVAESAELSEHLRESCSDCAGRLQESLERVTQIGLSLAPVAPSRALRSRIVQLVKPAPTGWRVWLHSPAPLGALTAAAACGIAVGVGLALFGIGRVKPVTAPTVVSRTSPPVIPAEPIAPPTAALPIAPQPAPDALAFRQAAVVQATAAELAMERAQIARLESSVRDKDAQLSAAEQRLATLQATAIPPSGPAPAAIPAPASQSAPATVANLDLSDAQARIAQLAQQVDLYKTAVDQQRRELNRNVQLASLLSVPDLKVLNLASTERGGGATARAMLTGRSAVFFASRLPGLQPGRSYQLWLMRRSAPAIVSAGVFRPDPASAAVLEIRDAASLTGLTAMAVTEEPAGGSPLPTGHKILIGLAKS